MQVTGDFPTKSLYRTGHSDVPTQDRLPVNPCSISTCDFSQGMLDPAIWENLPPELFFVVLSFFPDKQTLARMRLVQSTWTTQIDNALMAATAYAQLDYSCLIRENIKTYCVRNRFELGRTSRNFSVLPGNIVVSGRLCYLILHDLNNCKEEGDSSIPHPEAITLTGHTGQISAIHPLRDNIVISTSHDHTLRVWDIQSKKCLSTMESGGDIFDVVGLSGSLIATADWNGTVRIWDMENVANGKVLKELRCDGVSSITSLPQEDAIFISTKRTLTRWNFKTDFIQTRDIDEIDEIKSVHLLSDDQLVLLSKDDKYFMIVQASSIFTTIEVLPKPIEISTILEGFVYHSKAFSTGHIAFAITKIKVQRFFEDGNTIPRRVHALAIYDGKKKFNTVDLDNDN